MRLIDADALKQHYAWWGDTESGKANKELFDTIVDLQPTIGEWISVEERLPPEMADKSPESGWSIDVRPSDDVQVFIQPEKRQSVAWYSYTSHNWTTVDEATEYNFGEITHWQPLPPPPEVT